MLEGANNNNNLMKDHSQCDTIEEFNVD